MDSKPHRSSTEVSVIIPTHNRQRLLAIAIDSVLGQSFDDFELLVIDDGSNDGTEELVASYGNRVRYIFQENLGAAAARNTGVRAASNELLAFLDSDDRFAPEKLAAQVEAMTAHPEYLVSHTDEIWYRQGKILNQKNHHARQGGNIFARSLKLCVVGMSTVMIRRQFFDDIGYFDESMPCCEDYDLWLRASIRHPFLLVSAPYTIKDGGRDDQLSRIHRVGMDRYRIASILKVLMSGELNSEQEKLARQELIRKATIYGRGCLKHGRKEEGEHYLELAERNRVLIA
jgi:glycosyltransferase involved in cell wall biosynthesis